MQRSSLFRWLVALAVVAALGVAWFSRSSSSGSRQVGPEAEPDASFEGAGHALFDRASASDEVAGATASIAIAQRSEVALEATANGDLVLVPRVVDPRKLWDGLSPIRVRIHVWREGAQGEDRGPFDCEPKAPFETRWSGAWMGATATFEVLAGAHHRAWTHSIRIGSERVPVDLPLFPADQITGTVRELSGAPVPNAIVIPVRGERRIAADAEGRFELEGVDLGNPLERLHGTAGSVRAEAPGLVHVLTTPVEGALGGARKHVTVLMARRASLNIRAGESGFASDERLTLRVRQPLDLASFTPEVAAAWKAVLDPPGHGRALASSRGEEQADAIVFDSAWADLPLAVHASSSDVVHASIRGADRLAAERSGERPIVLAADERQTLILPTHFELSGHVYDAQGRPLSGALVRCFQGDRKLAESQTDGSGRYRAMLGLDARAPTSIRVRGLADWIGSATPAWSDSDAYRLLGEAEASLRPGDEGNRVLDLHLAPAHMIRGRVIDAHGEPVDKVILRVSSARTEDAQVLARSRGGSSALGYFSAGPLTPGHYSLHAFVDGVAGVEPEGRYAVVHDVPSTAQDVVIRMPESTSAAIALEIELAAVMPSELQVLLSRARPRAGAGGAQDRTRDWSAFARRDRPSAPVSTRLWSAGGGFQGRSYACELESGAPARCRISLQPGSYELTVVGRTADGLACTPVHIEGLTVEGATAVQLTLEPSLVLLLEHASDRPLRSVRLIGADGERWPVLTSSGLAFDAQPLSSTRRTRLVAPPSSKLVLVLLDSKGNEERVELDLASLARTDGVVRVAI